MKLHSRQCHGWCGDLQIVYAHGLQTVYAHDLRMVYAHYLQTAYAHNILSMYVHDLQTVYAHVSQTVHADDLQTMHAHELYHFPHVTFTPVAINRELCNAEPVHHNIICKTGCCLLNKHV